MPRRAHRAVDALEARALVELLRRIHAGEGFEVAPPEAGLARRLEAPRHQHRAGTEAAQLGQEIHLAQLADVGLAAVERCDPAAAADDAVALDDEVAAVRARIGRMHRVDLGIVDREPGALRAELRHDGPDDARDIGVVARLDRSYREVGHAADYRARRSFAESAPPVNARAARTRRTRTPTAASRTGSPARA